MGDFSPRSTMRFHEHEIANDTSKYDQVNIIRQLCEIFAFMDVLFIILIYSHSML